MKILLTGHRGFIGGHMLQALDDHGHDVTTCEWGDPFPDLDDSFDWVVHIGANSSTVERNVDLVMRQNYDFSVRLYNEACRHGVNFQWASSASVYGLVSTFREDAPVDPRNPYAWSKYMLERYVQQNPMTRGVSHGFRYFNVYGPEGEEHKGDQASPFYKFKQQQLETGQVKVFEGSESYQRDFVPVSQVVDTHLKFFDVEESGIWNIGTGRTMSFLDVARKYSNNIVEIPMPSVLQSNYQVYTCADTAKLRQTLADIQ